MPNPANNVTTTTEVGYCPFCGRTRNLRRDVRHLGGLVRTTIDCESCHRTLSSTIGPPPPEPEPEPEAKPEPEPAPTPGPVKAAAAKKTATKATATGKPATAKKPTTAKKTTAAKKK